MNTAQTLAQDIATATATIRCSCGSNDLQALGACREFANSQINVDENARLGMDNAGVLYRCRQCHLGFRYPQPSEEALRSLYGSFDAERWGDEPAESYAWREAWRYLATLPPSPRSVLDVGAFTGGFLSGLSNDWNKFAIEPSAQAKQVLESRSTTVVSDLLQPPTEELRGGFDVVTLFDVFEHLPDPHQGLQWAREMTKPEGVIIISTGNMDHWTWKSLLGGHWYVDPMQHLCFGSEMFFKSWAETHGVQLVRSMRIPHGEGHRLAALQETLTSIYFAARKRNSLTAKLLRRVLQALPTLRDLRHKNDCPYTRNLRDHVLVVLRVSSPFRSDLNRPLQ